MEKTEDGALWAFDFDGVICDSVGEVAMSGWKACHTVWTDLTGKWPETLPPDVRSFFVKVRPCLETGWESILLLRLAYERGDKMDCGEVLKTFQASLKAELLGSWSTSGSTEEDLVSAFKVARQDWLEGDREGWLKAHGFYPGAVDFVRGLLKKEAAGAATVAVITTKGKAFALELLEAAGLGAVDPSRVFGLGSGKKKDVLQSLMEGRPQGSRLAALETVMEDEGMSPVVLVLAGWGYNTSEDRNQAMSGGRIQVLSGPDCLCSVLSEPHMPHSMQNAGKGSEGGRGRGGGRAEEGEGGEGGTGQERIGQSIWGQFKSPFVGDW